MTRNRDMAAIALFLACVAAFAYVAWSKPDAAPFSGADATVYRESYRACEKQWRERAPGREPNATAMATAWTDRYSRERRTAARTGCLDAIAGNPPKA